MRIGLVCRHFSASRGGLEKDTLLLSEALVNRGHTVHLFCNTADPQTAVKIHHVPVFPFSSPGKNLSFAWMATRRSAAVALDVLQSMERIWSQDIFRLSDSINPVQMAVKYPHPAIHLLKRIGPRRQVLTLLERRIFQHGGARFILAISKLVKQQIVDHYRVPAERIVVIYNSVDTQRFNPAAMAPLRRPARQAAGVGDDEPLVLFVGNDFRRKGLPLLLEALAMLRQSPFKLLVAGSDPPGRYQRFAARHGIGDRVRFLGYRERAESLYAAADLLVLPTRDDTFGNVCLEAMACGVPVVTTRAAGASEIIDPGVDGYVLQTWQAGELAACLQALMPPGARGTLGVNAAQKAAGFTLERHMAALLALYETVCESKRRDCR